MSRPVKHRNRWAGVLVAGVVLCVTAFGLLPRGGVATGVCAVGGVMMTAIGGVMSIYSAFEVRSYRRLVRGEGLVARWRVEPHEWNSFLAINQEWSKVPNLYANYLDLKQAAPLEVRVSRRAALVGEDFHDIGLTLTARVERVMLVEANPRVVEVCGRIAGKSTSYPFALRFPVDSRSPGAGEAVVQAWTAEFLRPAKAPPGQSRRARNICLGICFAGMVALGAALAWPGMDFAQMMLSNVGALAAGGFMAVVFGGILAVKFHRDIPSR